MGSEYWQGLNRLAENKMLKEAKFLPADLDLIQIVGRTGRSC